MPSFETGVSGYVTGRAVVEQYWPIDERGNAQVNCAQCFFFRDASRRCGLTGEVSAFPNKYIGANCPMLNDEDFERYIKEEIKHD